MSVVAREQEDGDAAIHQGCEASRELALVRLRRVAALVGVAGDEDEVGVVAVRVVDHLVEGAEKVEEARGEAKVRAPVDGRGRSS